MATVEHPHIVRVYSFGEVAGRHYLVMEYVEGESLARRIRRLGKLPLDESLRMLSETLDALAAAWTHGIVHRDIKPANILLDAKDRVRVADFGLAKGAEVEGDSSITRGGQVFGTPHYVSPEQARGATELDFRTDVYSLGIVLYEMLTGEPPFQGATPISVIDQHLHTPVPPLHAHRPDVPGQLEQLCTWMVQKRPTDRPGSYEELIRSVEQVRGRATAGAAPPASLPSFLTIEDVDERLAAPVFVGRRQELDRLDRSLQLALAGEGQVVLVTGEAGSGKTALINEFARQAQARHAELIVAAGNCDAQTGVGDPYLPFREVLSLLAADVEFRRASREITREQARRLWSLLPIAVEALVDGGPDLLRTFISGEALVSRAAAFTPSPARWRVRLEELVRRSAETPRDSGLQQSYLFEQYARTLHALARKKPLLLQIEDLHWADSGSCGLLFHLARRIAHGRILIVCTYRPAEIELERDGQRHPMTPVINELRRELGELEVHVGEEGTREFVDELLDSEPNDLSDAFRDRLFRQTRAHPLFTVELVRSMREQSMLTQDDAGRWSEGPAMDWEMLPARVEGAIAARVDRLPQHMLQALTLASVQGEEFVAEVVAQLQGSSTRETVALLSGELDKRHRLVAAHGVRRMNGQRISTYRFRHSLFQKYLYGRMDETERTYTHEEIGNTLEALYAEHADEIAHQLARHFHEAGVIPKTIDYLRKAAERATRLSANEEAVGHLHRALQIVEELPDAQDQAREELSLQLALGPPLLGTVGPGSADLSRAYMRARELCDQVGSAPQLFQTLFILVHHHANQGRLPTALELAEQLLEVVENAAEPLPPVIAHWAKGFALIYLGRLTEALENHERVISLYDPHQHSALAYIFGMDPAVSSLCYGALALWCLGRIDQAQEYGRRGLTLARKLDHPSSTAHGLLQAAYLGAMRRDAELVQSLADELVALSTEHGVVLFRAWGTIFRGWAFSERGRHERAIERLVGGMVAAREAGSQLGHTQVLKFTAKAWARNGDLDKALDLLAEAMEMIEQTDERLHESEILRIKGELLLERDADPTEEAEAALRHAVEVARSQGAKPIGLRAAVSLGRLLQATDRRHEARGLLREVYSGFSEGLDTPDLTQAKDLLGEIS